MVEELKKDMVEAMKNHEKERLAVISELEEKQGELKQICIQKLNHG